jgi:hypothetical protein
VRQNPRRGAPRAYERSCIRWAYPTGWRLDNSGLVLSGPMPKPVKKKMTKIVHVEYWWCGDQGCTRAHSTESSAARCPKANRGLSLDHRERNEAIWRMVVLEDSTLERAAKAHGLTNQIVRKLGRQRGISSYFGHKTIAEIREAGKKLG